MKSLSLYSLCLALCVATGCGDDENTNTSDAGNDATADAKPDTNSGEEMGWDGGGGCESPEPPTPGECTGDFSAAFVLYTITGEVAEYDEAGDPATSEGFDLDCTTGLSCNCDNCGDFMSSGGDMGIDNQFARLFPTLDSALALSANLDQGIQDGSLLLIVKLDGLDSETLDASINDDCVDVSIINGVVPGFGAPELDDNMQLVAGQTLDIDSAFVTEGVPNIRFTGAITSGELNAGPATIPVSFPVGDSAFALTIQDGRMQASFADGALRSGLIGGVLDVKTTLGELNNFMPGLGDEGTLVANLLYSYADNVPNPEENGECSAISATLGFDSRSVVLGEVVDKPMDTADAGVGDGGQ